jgi:hypothetical protein
MGQIESTEAALLITACIPWTVISGRHMRATTKRMHSQFGLGSAGI